MYKNKKSDNITCNRCGETHLHWEDSPKGWRLFTTEGVMHLCYHSDKDKTKSYEKESWKWQKKDVEE